MNKLAIDLGVRGFRVYEISLICLFKEIFIYKNLDMNR